MQKMSMTGLFRAKVLSSAVTVSSNGFPRFEGKLLFTELYNEQEKEWQDWAEYDQGGMAYLTLAGTDKNSGEIMATFNHENCMEVFGWDGKSFAKLQAILDGLDEEFQLQVRVTDNTYAEAKNPFQINGIYPFDAPPTREVQKLETAALKDLDKMFGAALKVATAGKKPTKKKTKKKTAKKPATPPAANGSAKDIMDRNDAENKKIAEKKEAGRLREEEKMAEREASKAAPPKPPTPPKPKAAAEETCTNEECWKAICDHVDHVEGLTDADASNAYTNSLVEVCGEVTEETVGDVTPQQWALVRSTAIASLGSL